MVTSRLGARNLLHHPETLSFLAEIFLGALTDGKRPLSFPVSRHLFDLIVVRPSGIHLLEKLRARFALQSLVSLSVLRTVRTEPGLGTTARVLKYYFRMLRRPEFQFMATVVGMAEILAFGTKFRQHYPTQTTSLFMLLAVSAITFQTFFMMDRSASSAARLWFICCVATGLTKEDIAASVGSKWVLPIARYLEVADKLEGIDRGGRAPLTR
jgi:hypothetical protein